MDDLEHFASEFSKPFTICFNLLAKSNIFIHSKTKSLRAKLRSLILVILYVTFYFSLTLSFKKVFAGELGFYELANLLPIFIVATQAKGLVEKTKGSIYLFNSETLNAMPIYIKEWLGAMKGIVITSNISKVRRVIDELGAMWRSTGLTKKQITRKDVMLKRLNLCNAVFYWMNIVGTWQYLLAPLFETLFRTIVLGQDKLLFPFICTLPFDATQNWLVYLVTYFYESYSMLHLIYMYLGVEFLMITLCSHLATEFELLREEMLHAKPTLGHNDLNNDVINTAEDINDDIYSDKSHEKEKNGNDDVIQIDNEPLIENVIRRHQKLIMLSGLLDDIFNRMIFFNLLFATITICFFGFVAKIARDPPEMANNFVGVVASMIPIFNLCYYAEMLSGASGGVADSAYHNLWYGGDVRYQKSIIFIIARSQRPCSLTSMGYSQVTLNTFTTVLSTTWSYFSLAISVYETDK